MRLRLQDTPSGDLRLGHQLADQARLAHAGLPTHQQYLPAAGRGLPPKSAGDAELRLPADHPAASDAVQLGNLALGAGFDGLEGGDRRQASLDLLG